MNRLESSTSLWGDAEGLCHFGCSQVRVKRRFKDTKDTGFLPMLANEKLLDDPTVDEDNNFSAVRFWRGQKG